MDIEPLPEDLEELERQLAASRQAPPARLRGRVLAAVPGNAARTDLWRFAVGVAAVMLLCLNLAMSAANHMDWRYCTPRTPSDLAADVRQLREVAPGLSEREARAIAASMEGARCLLLVPDLRSGRGGLGPFAAARTDLHQMETTHGIRTAVD